MGGVQTRGYRNTLGFSRVQFLNSKLSDKYVGIFQNFIKDVHKATRFNTLENKIDMNSTLNHKVQQDHLLNQGGLVQESLRFVETQNNAKWIEIDESSSDETHELNLNQFNKAAVPKAIAPISSDKRKVATYRSKGKFRKIKFHWIISCLYQIISNFSKQNLKSIDFSVMLPMISKRKTDENWVKCQEYPQKYAVIDLDDNEDDLMHTSSS